MKTRHRSHFSNEERLVRSRLMKLLHQEGLVRGSIIEVRRSCGQKGCKCQRGHKHPSLYLGVSKAGKVQMVYIPKDWEGRVKGWVDKHKQVRAYLEKLSDLHREKLIKRKDCAFFAG
jgi:hypothetical protein